MHRLGRTLTTMIWLVGLACAVGGCSSDLGLNNVTLVPKPETVLRRPDWATFSGGKNDFELRPVTAADLVDPHGQCPQADQSASGSNTSVTAAGSAASGGIALQM